MKQRFLCRFRDWLFDLLIDYLVNSSWTIVIRDFKKSEKRSERDYVGLISDVNRVIYLDKDGGTPRILIHELCHFGLGTVFEKMSGDLPWKKIKKMKGRRRTNKEFKWRELRTLDFEKLFYNSLNKRQIQILQSFISEAKERYKQDNG